MHGPRTRVARRRQRALERARRRARRAAVGAGIAGLLVIAVMFAVAFSAPRGTARANAIDLQQPAAATSSAATSSPSPVAADPASAPSSPSTSPTPSAAGNGANAAAAPSSPPAPTAPPSSTSTSTTTRPASTVDTPAKPAGAPYAHTFGGTPVAGVLFNAESGTVSHFCSASVVHSAGGDLVITAAHCVYSNGPKSDVAFAPGYHDGQTPYGVWNVDRIMVSAGWQATNSPDEDVAFLHVAPNAAGASLESVTGADRIAFGTGFGRLVTVPAYPQGSDSPITCSNVSSQFSPTQIEWDCGGYPDGTSGAPLLTDTDAGGRGTVVGVIGGYQQGGDTPDVSYSSVFGSAVQALYQTASAV